MPKIELGPVGAVLSPTTENLLDVAVELEELGFSTIWLTGGALAGLEQIVDVVRATRTVRVASGIIAVDRFGPDEVAALYAELHGAYPGRFVVGLGGAHGARPLRTLNTYLDAVESIPREARVLAALGPHMLSLARRRTAGAFPVLVTPEYTAAARKLLGDDTTLAISQLAVLDTDPGRAREIARGPLGFLSSVPAYPANFRRMGFTDDEISRLDDRLVDALLPWGDAGTVAARVADHQQAGADHVAVSLITATPDSIPMEQWREVAKALIR